ncbi:MAG: hypothetical protein ACXVY9_08250 [Terriglobales bacterium]
MSKTNENIRKTGSTQKTILVALASRRLSHKQLYLARGGFLPPRRRAGRPPDSRRDAGATGS